MSSRKQRTLTALVRWRDFAESRASDTFRRCNGEVRHAQQELDAAADKLEDIQRSRTQLLDAPQVDLTLLQFAADIEEIAWQVALDRRVELDTAEQARDSAQAVYVNARAQTRVVDTRRERVATIESDRQEKTMFDWMADLYTQTRNAPR